MSETKPVTHSMSQGSIHKPLTPPAFWSWYVCRILILICMQMFPYYMQQINDVECVSKWCKQNRMVVKTDNTMCKLHFPDFWYTKNSTFVPVAFTYSCNANKGVFLEIPYLHIKCLTFSNDLFSKSQLI